MGHRDDLLVTRQYTRLTNATRGPPTRSVCLLGFVQVRMWEVWHLAPITPGKRRSRQRSRRDRTGGHARARPAPVHASGTRAQTRPTPKAAATSPGWCHLRALRAGRALGATRSARRSRRTDSRARRGPRGAARALRRRPRARRAAAQGSDLPERRLNGSLRRGHFGDMATTRQVEWSRTDRRSGRARFNGSCRWNTCWSVVSGKSCRDRAALRGTCIISSGRRDGMHRRVVLLACFAYLAATAQPRAVAVPYVGCRSDTFVEGPLEAPSARPKEIRISPAAAQRLAYYEAAVASGVLGPRGWYCFGYLGSAGATFEISPRPISADGPDLSGPLILLTPRSAETSGRFDVATIIARVFPAHRDFVTRLASEGLSPNFSFPYGPYPKDKLSDRKSTRL